jgi:hypothetical protein
VRIRNLAVAAIAVGVGVFGSAGSASAATMTTPLPNAGSLFGVSSITTPDGGSATSVGRTLTQVATGQNVGGTLSSTNIALECAAVATPAVATSIQACYLLGANGVKYNVARSGAKPGPGDAAAGAVLSVPLQSYRACIDSQALYQDGTYLDAPVVCA